MKNKIGVLFAVSVMALAGIGVSYAGFTDSITAYGTLSTADIDLSVGTQFSGTWVWKVWGTNAPIDEVYIDHTGGTAWEANYPGCEFLQVATATAAAGTGTAYDVVCTWNNIFPCIDFECDFDIVFTGSIPVKVNDIVITPGADSDWILPYVTATLRHDGLEVGEGFQLHNGDIVHCVITVHILQDDTLQDRTATATASLSVIQWNEG